MTIRARVDAVDEEHAEGSPLLMNGGVESTNGSSYGSVTNGARLESSVIKTIVEEEESLGGCVTEQDRPEHKFNVVQVISVLLIG